MIRYGDDHSIPELKKLWKECFNDEDAYIHDFFAALYKEQDVLLAEENGVLMGASFFLPGKLQDGDGPDSWQKIRYVYALAVYPQYRGRGIAGKLLRQAYQIYGTPLIAEPADEGLAAGFYEPLGFERAFYLEKEQIQIPHGYGVQAAEIYTAHAQVSDAGQTGRNLLIPSKQTQPADELSYVRIRDAHFAKRGYVKWPLEHVSFAIQEHRAGGGDALVITDGEKEDLLLYYIEDGKAVVTETTLSAAEAAELLCSYIPEEHLPHTVTVWKPLSDKNDVQENKDLYRLTGMIYGRVPVRGYLNLSLD